MSQFASANCKFDSHLGVQHAVKRPSLVSEDDAVCVLSPGLRAYTALHYKMKLSAGETVLILNGATVRRAAAFSFLRFSLQVDFILLICAFVDIWMYCYPTSVAVGCQSNHHSNILARVQLSSGSEHANRSCDRSNQREARHSRDGRDQLDGSRLHHSDRRHSVPNRCSIQHFEPV